MYRRILVPIDGSECANRGLMEAIKLAKSETTALRLVHVVNEFFIDSTLGSFAYSSELIAALLATGTATLKSAESTVLKQGLVPESILLERFGGRTADAIVQQAEQWPADLIVMGTHGRRGVSRLVMGSDAELVLRSASVPILMVPPPTSTK